jgi:uncharacterized membrane protein (UPF0127 family)
VRAALALVLVVPALAACGGDDERPAQSGTTTASAETVPGPELERVVIATEIGPVEVHAEVADDAAERETGLMHRESLDRDGGMLFVFDEDTDSAFWMKNTLIPLSIAFVGADGKILRILDMEPCTADPCPVYDPGVTYRYALEVNKGAFREWGVAAGDRLTRE